ncbi:MAG: nitrilase-related carbon-nitrogen hydrolase [Desulfatiglans sp.]|jgi:predicted amidohydrolase|nr:nitrilase-related carbon-nitrogen hydrolase [Thermodesulfobacteriota bacterium]MEE4354701.1 nitrilase-related carbon-nitrogen hydrolase [Desulfatiglans sp.]
MKVAVYQTSPRLLDLKANLEDVITKIHQGREKGAHLVVFPELALTGYFVGQSYHEVALRLDSTEINRLASATRGTAAVVGFIEESPSMNFYNSALVMVDGSILFSYRKLNLPNYGVFEERKYFSSGKQVMVFNLHDFNIAVFICNDLWHPSLPYLGVTKKADIFITIFNSSQGSMGDEFSNIESWSIINSFYSRVFGIYNICVNRVGEESFEERRSTSTISQNRTRQRTESTQTCRTESYRFWGGSEILNPFGKHVANARLYQEDEIFGDIQRDLLRRKKILLPYLRNDDPYFTHRELQSFLFDKSGVHPH